MVKTTANDYLLGPVRVDVAGRRLLMDSSGDRLAADTQQVEVLICLIAAYPAIVSKDELIEHVWGGRYVTDAALHKTLSNLRKLLREAHGGELIETRYRRGYQLVQAAVPVPALPAGADSAPVEIAPLAGEVPVPRGARARWVLIAILPILALALWFWRLPMATPVPELPPKPVSVAPDVAATLAALDAGALVQAVKDALISDPEFARQASAELRRRGATDLRLRGLADKYDGILAYRAGDFAQAEADYLRALPAFRAAQDPREEANVLNNLGVLLAETGSDPERADSMYRQALALREASGDQVGILGSHRNLSNLWLEAGRLDLARAAVAAYAAAAQAHGTPADRVEALILQGDVDLASGDSDPRPAFASAMALARESGLAQSAASASQRLGRLALRAGDHAGAREAFQRAVDWYRESGGTHLLGVVLYNLADAVAASGQAREAIVHYQAVIAADPDGAPSTLRVDTRLALARLHAALDESAAAARELGHAATEALALQSDAALAAVALARADFALRAGELIAARALLGEARQRMSASTNWELDAQWRQLDIWLHIAQGKLESAAQQIDRLATDATRHNDLRVHTQLLPARAALAGARGDWAASYRLQWQVGQPQSSGDQKAVNSDGSRASRAWMPWLALVSGLLLGGLFGQRWSSKPSV